METVAPAGASSESTSVAFARFYDMSAVRVFRYLARGVFGDRAAAEDLTQETFTAVVVAARAGRPEAFSMPWVMGVARHKLVDHYRHAARDQRHLASACSGPEAEVQIDDLDEADPGRALEILRRLAPEHQLVLLLRYVDGLPVPEIAAVMGKSMDATNSLVSRARRALASSLLENP